MTIPAISADWNIVEKRYTEIPTELTSRMAGFNKLIAVYALFDEYEFVSHEYMDSQDNETRQKVYPNNSHQDNSPPYMYWSWWVVLLVGIVVLMGVLLVGSCPKGYGPDGQ